jgi:hypothetical protein
MRCDLDRSQVRIGADWLQEEIFHPRLDDAERLRVEERDDRGRLDDRLLGLTPLLVALVDVGVDRRGGNQGIEIGVVPVVAVVGVGW